MYFEEGLKRSNFHWRCNVAVVQMVFGDVFIKSRQIKVHWLTDSLLSK